jgi:hypothetical protein
VQSPHALRNALRACDARVWFHELTCLTTWHGQLLGPLGQVSATAR